MLLLLENYAYKYSFDYIFLPIIKISSKVKGQLFAQVDSQGEVKKSKQEMDRLLQMVKVSQEEQSAKDKLIKELQE